MRTIHCIAFEPDSDSGSVGGVDWRVQLEAADQLFMERTMDADYDNCRISFFEVRVPEWMNNATITALVDTKAMFHDYVAIRRRYPEGVTQ